MNITIDIETVPAQDPEVIAELRSDLSDQLEASLDAVRAPGNYKDEAKIAAFVTEAKQKLLAEHEANVQTAYLKTGLDGGYGQVCCIGYAIDDHPVVTVSTLGHIVDERMVLGAFFAAMSAIYRPTNRMRFVGHNLIGFDLRFLWHRAMVLGIKPPPGFPRDPKPWDDTVYDTMLQWSGVKDRISLTKLCRILGVPNDDDIDGSEVWALYQAGRIEDIAEHCRKDVAKTRAVFKRMTFAGAA